MNPWLGAAIFLMLAALVARYGAEHEGYRSKRQDDRAFAGLVSCAAMFCFGWWVAERIIGVVT